MNGFRLSQGTNTADRKVAANEISGTKPGSRAATAVRRAVAYHRATTALPMFFTSSVFAYLAYICIPLFPTFIAGEAALQPVFGFIWMAYHTSSNNKTDNRALVCIWW